MARRAILAMALLGTALAPATTEANHQAGWQVAGAAVPASVDLTEVAAFGATGVVVAVGRDDGADARIFRRGGDGTWVEDLISLPGATESDLVDVDLSQGAAWAVGTYVDGGGAHPLTLRVEGGASALASGSQATWSQPAETLPDGVVPSAVGLRVTDGLIGTTAGTVYPFHDAAPGCTNPATTDCIDPAVSPAASAAGPINAIAHYDAGRAYTAGDVQPGGGPERIHKIDMAQELPPAQMVPVGMGPSDPDHDLVGVGAASESEAMAIEENADGATDPALWAPASGIWTRDAAAVAFTADSRPLDLSLRKVNDVVTRAAAGEHAGAGAVWRRTGGAAWTRESTLDEGQPLSDEPLNGVAVVDSTHIWAVGDGGAVVRYGPLPDPPTTSIDSGPIGETTATSATFTFSSDEPGATFECSLDGGAFEGCTSPKSYSVGLGPHTFRVRAVGAAGAGAPAERTFTVVSPSRTGSGGSSGSGGTTGSGIPTTTFQPPPRCRQVPRPLLNNVKVKKRRGRLLIKFDVAVASRVKAKAFHRKKLIGKTKMRVLEQGRHRLKLRYKRKRGKPTRLKMIARPAASDAC
ncbi:MAG: hypothetical protein ACRDL6_01865 [Solirubrobacterales bacterium]